jgi:hypothetical protein
MSGCTSLALINSAATCTVSYARAGGHSITASYGGDANFNGSASSTAKVNVQARILGRIDANMQWIFAYSPAYTRVIQLLVNGSSAGDTVVMKCRGKGCPFTKRVRTVTRSYRCARNPKHSCPGARVAHLISPLRGHRLYVGAKLIVIIERPDWIAKYYAFTMRSGLGPSIKISCLAPGRTKPGVGC